MVATDSILQAGQASPDQALALFDRLPAVDLEFMWGRWQGWSLHTGHPMDGLLEVAGWYGKEFVNAETVHPLLFRDGQGEIFKVAPRLWLMNLALRLPVQRARALRPLLGVTNRLLQTERSQARLRHIEYRQTVSATMIYDCLPIHDCFRRIDSDQVLGLMDFKGMPQPFFFTLTRD